VNRRVRCRFSGSEILLDLSLGLFSSAGVDSGSMFLLKTVAGHIPLDNLASVLDVGCGTGALGLSLAKRCPGAKVSMVDRDELAVEFSRRNAALNKLKNVAVESRLMLEGPHEGPYNLILSNFPAKAGDPVLADYLKGSSSLLTPGGTAAIVIVRTLADRCRQLLNENGIPVVIEEESGDHTVFHYSLRPDSGRPEYRNDENLLSPYIRHSGSFRIKRMEYRLDTVWNLSDFDTPSWRIQLMGEIIDRESYSGVMVFWAPGQGHLPLIVCRRPGNRPDRVILTGRDRLELLVSARNLETAGGGFSVETAPLPDPGCMDRFDPAPDADFLLTDITPVPRTDWTGFLKSAASKVLKPGGTWAILGRSSDIALLSRSTRGWTPMADKRYHGWRAAVFRKN
jgi:protein-L-isoaspartate O-methyltransferase